MTRRTFHRRPSQAQGAVPRAWGRVKSGLVWPFALLVLSACLQTGEHEQSLVSSGPEGNHPPVVRAASIQPIPMMLAEPLSVFVEAQDADQDVLSFHYRWFANDQLLAEGVDGTLDPKLLTRGDRVVVEVVPSDGKEEGMPFTTAPLVVGNTPPLVSRITIEPDERSFTRRVLAKADVSDPDGDAITAIYRWQKNETLVKEGEDSHLDITGFSTNDSIQVEVLASDGMAEAKPVASQVFVLRNTPPTFISSPPSSTQGGRYKYHAKAKDPDGDPVTFFLEGAPSGMTVHPQSGLIQWTVASDTKGTHRVRVVAKDGRGGFATQEFDLTLVAPAQS